MTTYAETQTRTTSWPMYAALGAGLAAVLTALGTFWDLSGNDATHRGLEEYLPVLAIIAVTTALVFGLGVRTATPENAGTRAMVLAVLALLSVVVFWAGLPAVLAAGAVACAVQSRSTTAKVAMGLAGLAVVAAAVLAVTG